MAENHLNSRMEFGNASIILHAFTPAAINALDKRNNPNKFQWSTQWGSLHSHLCPLSFSCSKQEIRHFFNDVLKGSMAC